VKAVKIARGFGVSCEAFVGAVEISRNGGKAGESWQVKRWS